MNTLARRDRRALWLGALVLFPVLAWRGVVAPLAASVAGAEARATTAVALFAREQALLRDGPRLRTELATANRLLASESPSLFTAADTASATSALAAWIRATARASGFEEFRVEVAAAMPTRGDVMVVQVDVRATGTIATLATWLARLDGGERLLPVERLDIAADVDGTLAISARVRGFARGGAR